MTAFTCAVVSTGTPDVRFDEIDEEGGGEGDEDDSSCSFPLHLFKVGSSNGASLSCYYLVVVLGSVCQYL